MPKDQPPKIENYEPTEAEKREAQEIFGISREDQAKGEREQIKESVEIDHARVVAEVMASPQHIMVSKEQIEKIMKEGEITLPDRSLYGRVLTVGEKVILEDEDLKEFEVAFVRSEKNKSGKSEKITVRLPFLK
ncbi:hypothetical protein K2P96_02245 [Patescibacteria group bacterium]|nr:hypothetical protein [Patescibacteria group bacterium]